MRLLQNATTRFALKIMFLEKNGEIVKAINFFTDFLRHYYFIYNSYSLR